MWRLLFRVYLYISILTLLIYGIDKLLAKMEWKRVPERWFHTLSLIGGFLVRFWNEHFQSQN